MKYKRVIQLVGGVAMCAIVATAYAANPYPRILTTIKFIESSGFDAVVHLNRGIENTAGCIPVNADSLDRSGKVRSFYIDYQSADGKSNYVLIMAAATARKRAQFQVSGCHSGTGLPQITDVEVSF